MIDYTLAFTRKADKDEADIYKYITEKFGEIYAENFRANFIRFAIFSPNSLLLAGLQKTMQQ
jgi:hypothetical protein